MGMSRNSALMAPESSLAISSSASPEGGRLLAQVGELPQLLRRSEQIELLRQHDQSRTVSGSRAHQPLGLGEVLPLVVGRVELDDGRTHCSLS